MINLFYIFLRSLNEPFLKMTERRFFYRQFVVVSYFLKNIIMDRLSVYLQVINRLHKDKNITSFAFRTQFLHKNKNKYNNFS